MDGVAGGLWHIGTCGTDSGVTSNCMVIVCQCSGCGYIDMTVYTQVLPPVVLFLRMHLTRANYRSQDRGCT